MIDVIKMRITSKRSYGVRWLSQNGRLQCSTILLVISIVTTTADCKSANLFEAANSNTEFESYQSEVVSNLRTATATTNNAGALTSGSSGNGIAQVAANSTTSELMVHEREFVSPLLRIQIDCQRDKTIVRVNFTKPFSGTLGAGKLETSTCKLTGDGGTRYELQVPHNATQCDTQWDNASSSISNTLFIRYHQSLETGSDLAKNIACRLTVGDLVVGRRPVKQQVADQRKKQLKKTTSTTTTSQSANEPSPVSSEGTAAAAAAAETPT